MSRMGPTKPSASRTAEGVPGGSCHRSLAEYRPRSGVSASTGVISPARVAVRRESTTDMALPLVPSLANDCATQRASSSSVICRANASVAGAFIGIPVMANDSRSSLTGPYD